MSSAHVLHPLVLNNFDFSFYPGINRAQIYQLATGDFVAQGRHLLLVGPPGRPDFLVQRSTRCLNRLTHLNLGHPDNLRVLFGRLLWLTDALDFRTSNEAN
jgi:hypothetical protein